MKQLHSLRLALAAVALLGLSACPDSGDQTGHPSPTPGTPSTTPSGLTHSPHASPRSSPRASSKASVRPAVIKRGIFIYGEDFQVFKACGTTEEIWVEDTGGKDLASHYKALHLMELEPAYVELSGELKPTGKSAGFAANFKRTLHVKKLQNLLPWVSDGTCFATDFVAQGSPPDWSLQILQGGDVFFKSNEGEFPFVDTLAYSPPHQEGNRWRYEFHFRTPEEDTLKAEFSQESCTQGGQSYEFSAKISFRGVSYSGCGKKL